MNLQTQTPEQIFVIGKGAKLLESFLATYKLPCELTLYSTAEFLSMNKEMESHAIYIVFSKMSIKKLLLYKNVNKARLVVVGSTAAFSRIARRFCYSRLKYLQYREVVDLRKNGVLISYCIFGDFYCNRRKGEQFYSDLSNLINDCLLAAQNSQCAFHSYISIGQKSISSLLVGYIDQIFAPLSSFYIKFLTDHIYGYSNKQHVIFPDD